MLKKQTIDCATYIGVPTCCTSTNVYIWSTGSFTLGEDAARIDAGPTSTIGAGAAVPKTQHSHLQDSPNLPCDKLVTLV